ncbi:MAG: hypothetical protein KDD61_08995 [Bdellovibrionales bacterium]|nr:hypothetical protein [Bdellovibrionales bacterium]
MKYIAIIGLLIGTLLATANTTPYDQLRAQYDVANQVPVKSHFLTSEDDPLNCLFILQSDKENFLDLGLKLHTYTIPGTPSKGPLFPGTPDKEVEIVIPKHLEKMADEFKNESTDTDFIISSESKDLSDTPIKFYSRLTSEGYIAFRIQTYIGKPNASTHYGYCWRDQPMSF